MGDRTTAYYSFPKGTISILQSIAIDWDEAVLDDESPDFITIHDCDGGHDDELEAELIRRRIPYRQSNEAGGDYGASQRHCFFDSSNELVIVEDCAMAPEDVEHVIQIVRNGASRERILAELGDDPRRHEVPDLLGAASVGWTPVKTLDEATEERRVAEREMYQRRTEATPESFEGRT